MVHKLLLVGRAASGKTSIKKVVFEGNNPMDLINNPLEPTRGIESQIYPWMDLELGLFDSSGQELDDLLKTEKVRLKYFERTNVIIYVFEYLLWENNSQIILDDIQNIYDIIEKFSLNTQLFIFLHKIDLINKKEYSLKKIEKKLLKKLSLPITPKIFNTSIHPDFIYNIYNAFIEIISKLSEEIINLTMIMKRIIKNYTKIICFIINQNNSIIAQVMTPDYNVDIIRELYKKISQEYLISEKVTSLGINMKIIEGAGPLIVNILKDDEKIINPNIKNIIVVAEDLDQKGFRKLITIMIMAINKHYKK